MWVIAEKGSRPQPHRIGPGAAAVRRVVQGEDETPRAFADRVLRAIGACVEDGGLVVYAGGSTFDAEVQAARTRIVGALARRAVATGAAIGLDATGVTGPSRHSLLALADAFSLVGPREGVMILDRRAARRTAPSHAALQLTTLRAEDRVPTAQGPRDSAPPPAPLRVA
jgi:hypothetical protein